MTLEITDGRSGVVISAFCVQADWLLDSSTERVWRLLPTQSKYRYMYDTKPMRHLDE